jgi:glutamate formiminotransferase
MYVCMYVFVCDVGEHPRLGALDVCPFIPVRGVTMDDCVECAKEFGERLALELGVPGIYSGLSVRFKFNSGKKTISNLKLN